MNKITELYSSLNQTQQLPFLASLIMFPSFIVYLALKVINLEKLKIKNIIIRSGVAFGMGTMLGDLSAHITPDLFNSILLSQTTDHDHHHSHHHDHHNSENNHRFLLFQLLRFILKPYDIIKYL